MPGIINQKASAVAAKEEKGAIFGTTSGLKGKLFVFTGTSGAGKTTLGNAILHEYDFFKRIVTCTTRAPREGEREGVDYHFFSREKFEKYLKEGKFLEHAVVYDNYYGSLKSEVEEVLSSGKSVLLIVDVQGAITIKKNFSEAVVIFIKAPSLSVLKKRLIMRGTDSMEIIQKRAQTARQELKLEHNFSHIIVNDKLRKAIAEVKALILKELKS